MLIFVNLVNRYQFFVLHVVDRIEMNPLDADARMDILINKFLIVYNANIIVTTALIQKKIVLHVQV